MSTTREEIFDRAMDNWLDRAETSEPLPITDEMKAAWEWYRARVRQGTTYIYAIQQGEDGPVKIGVAKNPVERLKTLQCGNPVELRGIGAWRDAGDMEKILHQAYAEYRIRGEWFEPAEELLETVVVFGWGYDWSGEEDDGACR